MTTVLPWQRGQGRPPRIRVLGAPESANAYRIRDFLRRSVVAYDWVELDDVAARVLVGLQDASDVRLPICEFPDGSRIESATVADVAARLGWATKARLATYDLAVYGAGPAGLSAAVHAAAGGLKTVLVERRALGGQAGNAALVDDHLGFPHGIPGAELADRARLQALHFGVEILQLREAIHAKFADDGVHVDLADGSQLSARTSIWATGIEWRRLGLAHEQRYRDAGLSYGAGESDAHAVRGETVHLVGGGHSAAHAALYLARFAREVVMVVRGEQLSGTLPEALVRRIAERPNLRVRAHAEVAALHGDEALAAITLRDRWTGDEERVDARHLFVCIGGRPHVDWANDTPIARDTLGYLLTGPDVTGPPARAGAWPLSRPPHYLETSVPGSFAAGDVRHGSVKRVVAAVGEGAMAVAFVHRHLQGRDA